MVWVQTNVANDKQAQALMDAVVGERLAACGNAWRIDSTYWWEGKVQHDREVAVHLKTRPGALRALVARVRELHRYEVPYIEWGTTSGAHARYTRWVTQETRARRRGTRRKI
jgi:periplasmic divalent cation tolerance protein